MRVNFFAPLTVITLAASLAVSLAVLSVMLSLNAPWLGVAFDFSYNGTGVRVAGIHDPGPGAGKLQAGDTIIALVSRENDRVVVSSLATLEEPDQLATYAQYNAFFAMQQSIWQIISSPSFDVILSDQRRITLNPGKSPSPAILPASFWWLLFFGGASFLLGISVWIMRAGDPVTRALAVSGFGFMVGAYSCAIYTARELALSARLFLGLAVTNHLGIMVFAYAAILFFWYYPRRLANAPAVWIYLLGVSALWLNETFQWLSWPIHAFYAHFLVAYFLLFLFSYLQWRQARGVLLERVLLRWLLTVMLLNLGITLVLFYAPVILTGKPIASTVLTFGSVFLFYVGLIIGNIRYHQFDMDHWWFRAWQWLVFILITLAADTLFVYFLNLRDDTSLGLAISVGGIYLLARQWLWERFSGRGKNAPDRAMQHLVEILIMHQPNSNSDLQWQQLVSRVFNPLSVKTVTELCEVATIAKNGIALHLPSIDGSTTIEVFCGDRGNRLFSAADVHLASRLLELMRHSSDLLSAQEEGGLKERRRIQRDLHDDVAARLLSLLHQSREAESRGMVQSALRGLRDVIHRLDHEAVSLMDLMSDLEASAREQLSGSGVRLQWHSTDHWPVFVLSSGQHINLRRITREATANALKYAHPENLIIEARLDNNSLVLRISNDGTITEPSGWIANRGLNNIGSRVAEMNGSHKWVIEQRDDLVRYCVLAVNVPLFQSE